jgi:hypothetical protein
VDDHAIRRRTFQRVQRAVEGQAFDVAPFTRSRIITT